MSGKKCDGCGCGDVIVIGEKPNPGKIKICRNCDPGLYETHMDLIGRR